MLRAIRPVLFWTHLAAGVVCGAIILLMSVTGVALTYEKQVIAWADRRALPAIVPGEQRIPLEQAVRVAREAHPEGKPTAVTVWSDPTAPIQVAFGREGSVFVHPYEGQALGGGATGVRKTMSLITGWHRWLGAEGDGRKAARAITGAANLAFLFLVLTGAVLWFPSKLTWTRIRNVLLFRRGLSGKARDFNWHNVLGVWSVVPLVVIVASGAVISYPWASDLVYKVVGEVPPPRTPPGGAPNGGGAGRGAQEASRPTADAIPTATTSLDALVASGASRVESWRTISVALAADPSAPVSVTVDRGTGGQPQLRGTLQLDATSGAVVSWKGYDDLSRGRRLRSWLRFAHTGEVMGIPGQTIAGLVSLASAVLVYTGIALAFRRLVRPLVRRSEAPSTAIPDGATTS